ncbi:hypothetical protein ASG83_06890 [Yonghaparkia sp. Soil809]|nr:hypothetical protein ASG83_06890 [Yonghaparkia sp. Soil809]
MSAFRVVRSAAESPAAGSSRSRMLGSPTSAIAISSCRCSPWERLATVRSRRSARPTDSRAASERWDASSFAR